METNNFYITLLFDVNRGGFIDIAEKILNYLDYASLIRFKQVCKIIYEFIKSSNLEQVSVNFVNSFALYLHVEKVRTF